MSRKVIDAISSRILVAAAALAVVPAFAQPSPAQQAAIRDACRSDYMANCSGVPAGGQASLACLQQNAAKLSPACQQALRAASGSAPAAPAPSAAAPAPVSAMPPGGPASWPHTVSGAERQRDRLPAAGDLVAGAARRSTRASPSASRPTGAKQPVARRRSTSPSRREADLAERTVVLTDPRLVSAQFPSVDAAQAARFEERDPHRAREHRRQARAARERSCSASRSRPRSRRKSRSTTRRRAFS